MALAAEMEKWNYSIHLIPYFSLCAHDRDRFSGLRHRKTLIQNPRNLRNTVFKSVEHLDWRWLEG
jgi:hypothetical protein